MKLTMRRTGQFDCHWTNTHNKCGTTDKLQTAYTYSCEIESEDRFLDSHGFLFDQLGIDRYFQERYWSEQGHSPQSCEQIAISAVREIRAMLNDHFKKEHKRFFDSIDKAKISVSIGHGTPAVMTATWEA